MKRFDWFILALILSTFVAGFILYPELPNKIPLHWNLKGEVDNYGSKFYGVFLMPFMNLGIFILLLFLPKVDPRKDNYKRFSEAYRVFRYALHIFLTIMFVMIMLHSLMGPNEIPRYLNISFVVPFFVSILYIIIGNYMGKIKDNFFFGIRNPWTLSSEEVWYRTHRLGSKLFVLSGILGIIGSFFNSYVTFAMLIGPILASVLITNIYSYLLFQKEN